MSDSANLQLAARWRRAIATAIDAVLVPALTILLVMVTDVAEDAEDFADGAWMFHVLGLAVLSYLTLNGVSLWRHGQTLGKKLMKIMIARSAVVDRHGSQVPFDAEGDVLLAPFWKLICLRALFFPTLYLLMIPWATILPLVDQLLVFRKGRRCLHDLVSGTVVLERQV